ncbi:MAG: helix-turn-helix domain-containing protein [Patescibacteria group bacterium]
MPKLLNNEQVLVLKEAHKKIRDKRLADRIKAVLSLNEGFKYEYIAKILLLNEVTLNRYIKRFKAEGIKGLLEMKYKGG